MGVVPEVDELYLNQQAGIFKAPKWVFAFRNFT